MRFVSRKIFTKRKQVNKCLVIFQNVMTAGKYLKWKKVSRPSVQNVAIGQTDYETIL